MLYCAIRFRMPGVCLALKTHGYRLAQHAVGMQIYVCRDFSCSKRLNRWHHHGRYPLTPRVHLHREILYRLGATVENVHLELAITLYVRIGGYFGK